MINLDEFVKDNPDDNHEECVFGPGKMKGETMRAAESDSNRQEVSHARGPDGQREA